MRYIDSAMATCLVFLACSLGVSRPGAAGDSNERIRGPLEPQEALKHFRLPEGVTIEVAAAEPEVVDPIEVRFDEAGRMWVVEMRDYPFGPPEGQPPRSQIKTLEDRDQDGRYETVTVFADQLLFVTGLQPWKGGVIVTMAGEVAWFEDSNGDGRADQRETWFTGFAQENSQLRANHPRLGPDGHVYIANGLRGGTAVDKRRTDVQPLPLGSLDFRFDPLGSRFETVTGVGQFGLTFDDNGNRFICSNRNPLMHIVMEDRFLKRNPLLAVPEARGDVALAAEQSRLFPLSRAWTTSNLHANQFTAACGVLIFRGDGLPARYVGAGFTCDPTGNLVHCEILKPTGATFTSQPEREGVEFLASPDEWFRPVNLEHGPDGALYVVDMYRAVIEHPDFMPDELKRRPDLMLGTDRGRIYRVRRDGKSPATTPPAGASPDQLVRWLDHPNGWQRDTAARLLLEQSSDVPREPLVKLSQTADATHGRVRALRLLQAKGALTDELLLSLFADPSSRIREQAAWVCDQRAAKGSALRSALVKQLADPEPRVRFAAAMTLAPFESDDDIAALASAAAAGASDVWQRRAVALAAGELAPELLLTLVQQAPWQGRSVTEGELALLELLSGVAGALPDHEALGRLVRFLLVNEKESVPAAARQLVLRSLAQTLPRRGTDLHAFVEKLQDAAVQKKLRSFLEQASGQATDRSLDDAIRILAIDLLVTDPGSAPVIRQLALEETAQAVRVKALAGLSRSTDLEPWKVLLARFGKESPAIRRAVLDGLLSRPDRAKLLLDEIQAGRVKSSELDRVATSRLLQYGDAEIRGRATKVLADAVPADRQRVLAEYRPALELASNPKRGQELFTKTCATCHRIGDIGVNVAPDISDSRVKTAEQILADVLQPNRAIDNNYVSYIVTTTDGVSLTGIIAAESTTSITLKQAEGKTATLLREQIEEMKSTGVSLMPEGLEKNLSLQDMADLIGFVKNWRYLDGLTPLGTKNGN